MPWNEDESLPFAPGTSPFHIKGVVYRAHVEYANEFIPGGTSALNGAFRNPALRAFFEQPFLAASWYDALPIVSVSNVGARVLKQPRNEFLKVRTRHQANQDIHGVYRLLLKLASAEAVALRIPRAINQYFDFGRTEVHVVRPGVVRLDTTGMPGMMAAWFATVAETYLHVALEIAGAKRVHVRRYPLEQLAEAHGLPIARVLMDVQFDTAQVLAERSEE